jgi:GT2 family glycosyltransferase
MSLQPKLDVIIVNWNAGPALRGCLQSVAATARDGFELDRVVVVDNASSDGSARQLHGLDLPLTVIENTENRGFGAACNQGAENSRADYLLFLNPDTRVFSETFARSVQWLSSPEASNVGILGVQLIDENGAVSRSCARFPAPSMFLAKMLGMNRLLRRYIPEHFHSEWDHEDSRYVDQVMGAYFLVRNSLFQQLNGFDERFFVYFEEVDFSLRANRSGWKTYFLASTQCFHRGCGTTDQVKAYRLFYSLQSRILYAFKNMSTVQAWWLSLTTLFIEPLTRMLQGTIRFAPSQVAEVAHGYWLLYRKLPRIIHRANHNTHGSGDYREFAAQRIMEE